MSFRSKTHKYESFQVFFRGRGKGCGGRVNLYLPRKMESLGIHAGVVETSSYYLLDLSTEVGRIGVDPAYVLVDWLRKRDWVGKIYIERGEHIVVRQTWME